MWREEVGVCVERGGRCVWGEEGLRRILRKMVVTEDQSGHRGTVVGHKVMETPGR